MTKTGALVVNSGEGGVEVVWRMLSTLHIFLIVYILFYITYEQKARRGDDDVSLEERYSYFTCWLAGLNEYDRSQHHLKQAKVKHLHTCIRTSTQMHTHAHTHKLTPTHT